MSGTDSRPRCACGAAPIVRLESTGLIARVVYLCSQCAPDYGDVVALGYYRSTPCISQAAGALAGEGSPLCS